MATLREIRLATARALDDIGVYAVLTSTGTTVVLNQLLTALSGASTQRYDQRYIYVQTGSAAGIQRQIRPGSYVPSTGSLTTFNSSGWDATIIAGDTVELTGLFPSAAGVVGEATDYRSLINRGIGHLIYPDHLDVTTVADQWEYSLSAYPWLDRETRLVGVLDPARASGVPRRETWRRFRLKLDGGTPTLQFLDRPYPASGFTFQVVTLRPAFTLINGATSTVGLSSDTDTTSASVEDAVTATLMFAYEALMNRTPTRPNGNWSDKYQTQAGLARGLAAWDWTQQAQQAAPAATAGAA